MSFNQIQFFNGNGRYRLFWVFVALAAMCIYLFVRYEQVFMQPNDCILNMALDGLKNYFTTAWHLKYDPTRLGYQGMSHPYGEHILFSDNQPALVNTARLIGRYVPAMKDQGVALINLFQLFQLVFSVFCFVLLFRRLDLPGWYGALASFLLVLLTPQHIRWDGHFGLSQVWVIPLLLLLLHTYEQRKYKRRISLTIGLLGLVAAQFHMYYFGLFVLFLSIYHLVSFLRIPKATRFYKRIVHWLLMLIVPYGLLNIWIQASHFAGDRPADPYGFNNFHGFWEGIFLPYPEWPMYKWIDTTIAQIRPIDGESNSYVGIFATLFFLFVVFRGFRVFKATEPIVSGEDGFHRNYLRNIWWSAVALGAFSCGFPHAIPGLEWLTDYYGPIKQFRSMGRFNWLLFYVFNVAALYWVWHFAKRQSQIWVKTCAITLPFLLLSYEAYQHQDVRRAAIWPNMLTKSDPNSTALDWVSKLDTASFQAIYPMPYYHIGSDNISLDAMFDVFLLTQRTGYATGLPDMGVFMSRTPLHQTLQQVQLGFEPVEMPRILHDMVSEKDLALLTVPTYADKVKAKHGHLLAKAQTIFSNKDATLYRLPLDSLKAVVRAHIDGQKEQIWKLNLPNAAWVPAKTDAFFYQKSYDDLREVLDPMAGAGALSARMSDTTMLFHGSIPEGRYYISYWINATIDLGIHAELKMEFTDRSTKQRNGWKHEGSRLYVKTIKDGWALIEVAFEVKPNTELRAYQHKKGVDAIMQIDEVQIRPQDCDVFYRDQAYLVKNNRWYAD
jgi:hypothetical protein